MMKNFNIPPSPSSIYIFAKKKNYQKKREDRCSRSENLIRFTNVIFFLLAMNYRYLCRMLASYRGNNTRALRTAVGCRIIYGWDLVCICFLWCCAVWYLYFEHCEEIPMGLIWVIRMDYRRNFSPSGVEFWDVYPLANSNNTFDNFSWWTVTLFENCKLVCNWKKIHLSSMFLM